MEDTTPFPTDLAISLPLGSVLSIGFLIILAIFIIYAIVLHYHWSQYSTNGRITFLTYLVFAGSTIPLLVIMGLTALTA